MPASKWTWMDCGGTNTFKFLRSSSSYAYLCLHKREISSSMFSFVKVTIPIRSFWVAHLLYDEIVENNSPAPTIYNHVSIVIREQGEEKWKRITKKRSFRLIHTFHGLRNLFSEVWCILCLIRNSPNLEEIEIEGFRITILSCFLLFLFAYSCCMFNMFITLMFSSSCSTILEHKVELAYQSWAERN